ncbi:Hsp20/alpha crystallin family protein [Pyramidobacter sp. YE332]|uniref:Hsp20/alpha crystallin family protein n=1 Tax=unclassified Pyramidobacter TaxID=2632171 RepID=UPI00294B136A|nr:Hsp20/alpha crystallin family protein [Pyramidobacter sp. YE332]WOL41010.1 Hsp20/alpha crystallin family protein [Pyramidobacter sp. YE332]
MMVPSIWNDNLFDELENVFSDGFFRRSPLYGRRERNMMKTDVRETESNYEVDVDLPGFKKENVNVQLQNGYLTISAVRQHSKEEKDAKGAFIRQERYEGSCSRSFYVGDGIKKEDISAKLEDGILRLTFPKKSEKELEQSKLIEIE